MHEKTQLSWREAVDKPVCLIPILQVQHRGLNVCKKIFKIPTVKLHAFVFNIGSSSFNRKYIASTVF